MFKDIGKFIESFLAKLKNKKASKRVPFVIALCAILVLIPTLVAIWSVYGKTEETFLSSNDIKITLWDIAKNQELISEEINEKNISDSHTANMLYNINSGKELELAPINAPLSPNFKLTISSGDRLSTYMCYFSHVHSDSYITDESGKKFSVDSSFYKTFLNSNYSVSAYQSAVPPTLSTENGSKITPSIVEWYFKKESGAFERSFNYSSTLTEKTYQMHGSLELFFDIEPTSCTVEVLERSENKLITKSIYSGDLNRLSSISSHANQNLLFKVNASWEKKDDSTFYGSISYTFAVECKDYASFELSADTVAPGEFIVITLRDVGNPSSVIYKRAIKSENEDDIFSNKLSDDKGFLSDNKAVAFLKNFSPTFVKKNNVLRAFLPIPYGTPEGSFSFSISSGVATRTFTVTIAKKAQNTPIVLSADLEEVEKVLSDSSLSEIEKAVATVAGSISDSLLFSTAFSDLASQGFSKKHSFNETFSVEGIADKTHFFLGDFYATEGSDNTSVTSLGIGRVVQIGNTKRLGNYVAVDHGMGLCIWYCNLASIDVSKGDAVAAGELLGKSGRSPIDNQCGTLILCSMYDTLIDPQLIIGKQFSDSTSLVEE